METQLPNLFEALFQFRPRGSHTPKENFLSELFAHFLRTDQRILDAWLSRLLGNTIRGAVCQIKTRQTERDVDDMSMYPDMFIDGQLDDGSPVAVYCEHKWDSGCDNNQLTKYSKLAASKGKHARLVFVGATNVQRSAAVKCFVDRSCGCFLWEDVYVTLDTIPRKPPLLKEFLTFMKSQGLSPGKPLTVERMRSFLQASDFAQSLIGLAHKLDTNHPLEARLPPRYHADKEIKDAYGTVAIWYLTRDWKPWVACGFLYDPSEHRVGLVNPARGIDLFLRIAADPKQTNNISSALDVMNDKRNELRKTAASVLLKGEPGNGNKWSIMIVRDCLGDVIGNSKTEADQLVVVQQRLSTWLDVLFKDGRLEKAFKKCGLDSGMK
jgi:hypothetical protein